MPAPTYIIGKVADPIFALFIGLSAAATRINREEKDKGRSTSETINAGLRYACPSLVCRFLAQDALCGGPDARIIL